MGLQGSRLEKELGDDFPLDDRYFGCENYGNTCYCNSVLQALYFCKPFRDKIVEYYEREMRDFDKEENLLTCTADFFYGIHSAKKRTGVTGPKRLISRLRKENEIFRGYTQQDAHEFLNFLLNEIAETLEREQKHREEQSKRKEGVSPSDNPEDNRSQKNSVPKEPGGSTWIHSIFEGILTNETKCLTCDSVTNRDEAFLDLSIEIEQNTSVPTALRNFSKMEMLRGQEKFFCDTCHSKQEAEKCIKIKRLPTVLVLHLKRFKYMEQIQRFKKLGYRVPFPLELRLENTTPDAVDADRLYTLYAIVIHIGSGPNQGHYVSIIKSGERWLFFDDENIQVIDEKDIRVCFGATNEMLNHIRRSDSGYLLFYQSSTVTSHSALALRRNSKPVVESNSAVSPQVMMAACPPTPARIVRDVIPSIVPHLTEEKNSFTCI